MQETPGSPSSLWYSHTHHGHDEPKYRASLNSPVRLFLGRCCGHGAWKSDPGLPILFYLVLSIARLHFVCYIRVPVDRAHLRVKPSNPTSFAPFTSEFTLDTVSHNAPILCVSGFDKAYVPDCYSLSKPWSDKDLSDFLSSGVVF